MRIRGWRPRPYRAALAAGGLLVCFKVFKWHLVEVVGPRAIPAVGVVCWTAFAAALLLAGYHFVRGVRGSGLRAAGLAAVLAVAFALAWLAPLSGFVREANFRVNLAAREKVVAMVQAGELADEELSEEEPTGEVILPCRLRYLSVGGKIDVAMLPDRMTVLFYSHRTEILGFEGFAYVSDYVRGKYDCGNEFYQRVKLQDYWYYGKGEVLDERRVSLGRGDGE